MRGWSKPVVIAVCIFVSALLAAGVFYGYLVTHASRIFNTQVSSLAQRRVEARFVKAEFPASLLIEDLSVDGLLTCPRAKASLDFFSLFRHDVRISAIELDRPLIHLVAFPSADKRAVAITSRSVPVSVVRSFVPRTFILSKFVVRDGILKLDNGYEVDQIQLQAVNVPLTHTPARTAFFLTASLTKLNAPFIGHFLKASGWLNWSARDMEAVAQVVDDDGRVGLDVKFVARQNVMNVFGTAKLASTQASQSTGQKAGLIENVVLGVLSSTATDIDTDFSFKTRMDRFELGPIHLSGRITTGLNSSATSGNIVAGLKAVAEELLKGAQPLGADK